MPNAYHELMTLQAEQRGLAIGQSSRMDCPSPKCGGVNTVACTMGADGSLSYCCFRAGCTLSGRTKGAMTGLDLLNARRVMQEQKIVADDTPFELAPHILDDIDIAQFNGAKAYLAKYPFIQETEDVLWDVKEARIVFEVLPYGEPFAPAIDAIGRATDGRTPKYRKYGKSGKPYVLNTGHKACVCVEDVVSAIRLAQVMPKVTIIALLGTKIPESYISTLTKHDLCVLVLDRDAQRDSIKLMQHMSQYMTTTSRPLERDDIKDMGPREFEAYHNDLWQYLRKKGCYD